MSNVGRRLALLSVLFALHCGKSSPGPNGGGGGSPDLSTATGNGADMMASPDLTSHAASDLGPHGSAFLAVQAIFDKYCTKCHDASLPMIPEGGSYPQVPLTADISYATLVNQPAIATCGGLRVKPGDANNSFLFHKVNDAAPCSGLRMPRNGLAVQPPPLSPQEIGTISSWIQSGAPY